MEGQSYTAGFVVPKEKSKQTRGLEQKREEEGESVLTVSVAPIWQPQPGDATFMLPLYNEDGRQCQGHKAENLPPLKVTGYLVTGHNFEYGVSPLLARAVNTRHVKRSSEEAVGSEGSESAGAIQRILGPEAQSAMLGADYYPSATATPEELRRSLVQAALSRADTWLKQRQKEGESDIGGQAMDSIVVSQALDIDGWGVQAIGGLLPGRNASADNDRTLHLPTHLLSFSDRLRGHGHVSVARALEDEVHSMAALLFSLRDRLLKLTPKCLPSIRAPLYAAWWASHRWRMRHLLLRAVHPPSRLPGPPEDSAQYSLLPTFATSSHMTGSKADQLSVSQGKRRDVARRILEYVACSEDWIGSTATGDSTTTSSTAEAAMARLGEGLSSFNITAFLGTQADIATATKGSPRAASSPSRARASSSSAVALDTVPSTKWREWDSHVEMAYALTEAHLPLLYMDTYLPGVSSPEEEEAREDATSDRSEGSESESKDEGAWMSSPEEIGIGFSDGESRGIHFVVLQNGLNVGCLMMSWLFGMLCD